MSSAYMATMPTLQIRNNPGTAMRIHNAPGSNASTAHNGSITTRWRTVSRPRQPASVSSCLTHSRFRSGSRPPSANSA
jgi:hypothetical protein